MSSLKLVPAIEENFFKDRCFADQRVAGANPFQLWRVTNEKGKLLHWFMIFLRLNMLAMTETSCCSYVGLRDKQQTNVAKFINFLRPEVPSIYLLLIYNCEASKLAITCKAVRIDKPNLN